jgi:hypothetical protein
LSCSLCEITIRPDEEPGMFKKWSVVGPGRFSNVHFR